MSNEKAVKLIAALLIKTSKRQLPWKEISSVQDAFELSFPDSSISIQDTDNGYLIVLFNKDGREVECYTPAMFSNSFESPNNVFREIYDGARRAALGSDVILDSMIERLEKF